jgi:hypothetical protein
MLFDRKVNLDEVSVAAPCPVNWDAMEGDSRVRFCSLCQLNVYNISEMPLREAEALLKNQSGQLCLRLYRRQDGTLITKDCPVVRRMLDGAKKRLRAIAAAFIAMLNAPAVFGQQQNLKSPDQTGIVDGPPGLNMFQGEPTAIGGRFYTPSRSGHNKKLTPVPTSGKPTPDEHCALTDQTATQLSDHPEVKNNADTSALDAFRTAQAFEEAKEPNKALAAYEHAMSAFRNSKVNYDKKFAAMVAKKYARLLRKQHNSQQAAKIEKEFCGRK